MRSRPRITLSIAPSGVVLLAELTATAFDDTGMTFRHDGRAGKSTNGERSGSACAPLAPTKSNQGRRSNAEPREGF